MPTSIARKYSSCTVDQKQIITASSRFSFKERKERITHTPQRPVARSSSLVALLAREDRGLIKPERLL